MKTFIKLIIYIFTIIEWSIKLFPLIIVVIWLFIIIPIFLNLHLTKALIEIINSLWILPIWFIIYDIYKYTQNRWFIFWVKILYLWISWNLIFSYYKSKNIIKNLKLKESFLSLLKPFETRNYYDLKEIEKKLIKDYKNNLYSIYINTNRFFWNIKRLSWIHVIDIEYINNVIAITLYFPSRLSEEDINKIQDNFIIKWIKLSVNKYEINREINNNIKLFISKKSDKKNYFMKDCLNDLKKDALVIWYNSMSEPLIYNLDFSTNNHFIVSWESGSGKTSFDESLIYQLAYNNPNYSITILDIKGDLNTYKNIKNIRYEHTIEWIIRELIHIKENLDYTNDIFFKAWVKNFNYYQKLEWDKINIKPKIILFEELSYFLKKINSYYNDIRESNKIKKQVIDIISELSLAWRSAGHCLFLSLQIPLIDIIWDSEISRNMKNITFAIDNNLNQNIFSRKVPYNLDKLSKWCGIYKNKSHIEKFKAIQVDQESIELLKNKRWIKDNKSIKEKYLEYAKTRLEFSKSSALNYWLKRTEFDELSKNLQEKGVIYKTSNNVLKFTQK